jgi:hypothetical protein
MQAYTASFDVASEVQIADLQALEDFLRMWRFHSPLRKEQLAYAGRSAHVAKVGFHHSGGAQSAHGAKPWTQAWGGAHRRPLAAIVSEMTEDERDELRAELEGDGCTSDEWTAAWNDDLARRMAQIERGEAQLQTEEEFFADDE